MTDDFDVLFPKSAQAFSLNTIDAAEFLTLRYKSTVFLAWEAVRLSGDLLSRCASWRQPDNLFASYRFSSLWHTYRRILADMAKQSYGGGKSAKRPVFKGFIDFRLDVDQLAELDGWLPTADEVFAYVDEALTHGYRLTLSYSPDRKLATCTMFDDEKSRKSAGYALSTSDRDCALALKAMMFKHAMVLDRSWELLVDRGDVGGQRG